MRLASILTLSVSLFLGACEQPPTATHDQRLAPQSLLQGSKSPLERTTFDAEVTISVSGVPGTAREGKHREFSTVIVLGRVIHGTGWVDLSSLDGMPAGMPTHLPVMETDFGHKHGARSNQHGRGLTREGRMLALDSDASDDQGPSTGMRFSQDGQTIASSTQDWKRKGDVWELREIVATQFSNGQPVRRTVVKVKVRRGSARASVFAPASAASLSLAVADNLGKVGHEVLDVFSPTMLWAQETTTNWNDGIIKGLSLIGALILAGGAIIEGAVIGLIGGIVVLMATLWDWDTWANAANWGELGNGGDLCSDYEDALEAYPEDWDPELDYLCFG